MDLNNRPNKRILQWFSIISASLSLSTADEDVDNKEEEIKIPEWLSLADGVRTRGRVGTVVPGTLDRLIGMLTVASEELPDCPFYFQSDRLCSTLRATVPKMALLR